MQMPCRADVGVVLGLQVVMRLTIWEAYANGMTLTGEHQPGHVAVLGRAGTRGPMDLMEVPSHVMERFASAPSTLSA